MVRHNILSNMISVILSAVVLLMIIISTILVVTYVTGVINSAVAFASSDQMAKLYACGITPPAALIQLQADIPTVVLPAIYVGFPGLMIIIAILAFLAGHYYGVQNEEVTTESTTSLSSPNRSLSGKYKPGRRVEKTQTEKTTKTEG